MDPEPKRCKESWRLSGQLSEQCQKARTRGVNEDDYPPFNKVLNQLRDHFKTCPACRAWVDDWEKHGNQTTHPALR